MEINKLPNHVIAIPFDSILTITPQKNDDDTPETIISFTNGEETTINCNLFHISMQFDEIRETGYIIISA